MFRLFWVIFRPFKKQIQVYKLGDLDLDIFPLLWVIFRPFKKQIQVYKLGPVSWRAWRRLKGVETCRPKILFYVINCCVLTDILCYICVKKAHFHRILYLIKNNDPVEKTTPFSLQFSGKCLQRACWNLCDCTATLISQMIYKQILILYLEMISSYEDCR